MKHILKRYWLPMLSVLIAISCGVGYTIIGSRLSPEGILIEPFALIPLTYVFIAISVISFIIITVINRKKKI